MILVGDRPPDVLVGGRVNPYLRRWWIIPRNRLFNVYLHEFLRSDDDRALHDHPWWSLSFLLEGEFWEHGVGGRFRLLSAPSVTLRSANYAHRIELIDGARAVTLFITGPKIREWGFLCPRGWRHWAVFSQDYNEATGDSRGCDP